MSPRLALAAVSLATLVACGGAAPAEDQWVTDQDAVETDNGLSVNGLSTNGVSSNGLSTNGLSTNGLSTNGLSTNGLSTNGFKTWFASNPSNSNMVMKYLARCALPAGRSLSYINNGISYTWPGNLGLAPNWADGSPIDYNEQQVISACLAAHANKYGVEVSISVRGHDSWGRVVPVTPEEDAAYTSDEGCFFGNLFDGTGVYSAYSVDSPLVNKKNTSLRACAANGGAYGYCPPMHSAKGSAQQICSGGNMDDGYWSCVVNGVSYRPVCVKLKPTQFNLCGDGVCQKTESCYDLWSGLGCLADCGICL